jgi:hypothetical protein
MSIQATAGAIGTSRDEAIQSIRDIMDTGVAAAGTATGNVGESMTLGQKTEALLVAQGQLEFVQSVAQQFGKALGNLARIGQ